MQAPGSPAARRSAARLVLCAVSMLCCSQAFATDIRASRERGILGSTWTLKRLSDFPIANAADMTRVHGAAIGLRMRLAPSGSGEHTRDQRAAVSGLDSTLYEIEAFTAPGRPGDEEVTIVNFASSQDTALKRLREQVRLPPPPGGAVVRFYSSKEAMPGPIRSLFGADTAGITHWSRYIAVLKGGKSGDEIADIVSHELVHAYLLSILGPDGGGLPRWFHEGAALYLSGGRLQYVSSSDFGRERVSYNPKDYNEFRLVFRYLDETRGTRSASAFIREAVRQRSFERPLLAAAGISDYEVLRQDAWGWYRRQAAYKALGVLSAVGALGCIFYVFARRRSARVERAMALVEEARMLSKVGLFDEALENLDQARTIEPYLQRVRMAIQQVEDEVHQVRR